MKGNLVSSPKGGVKYCSLSTYPRTGYVQYAHTLAFINLDNYRCYGQHAAQTSQPRAVPESVVLNVQILHQIRKVQEAAR